MWWLNNTNQGLTAVKAEKEVECQVERAALGWHRHRFDHLIVKLTPVPFIVWTKYMYKVIVICINPWKVLYNIGVSLLHARRPSVAFDILVEVITTQLHIDVCSLQKNYFNIQGCWCSLSGPARLVPSRRVLSDGWPGENVSQSPSRPDCPSMIMLSTHR